MSPSGSSISQDAGHSLLDLVCAIALFGTLVSPMLAGRMFADLKLYNAHHQLASDLNVLALDALQAEHKGTLELHATSYTMVSNSMQIAVRNFPAGVSVSSPHELPTTITFYPTSATTPITIELQSSQRVCRVTVSLRGRVRSECVN